MRRTLLLAVLATLAAAPAARCAEPLTAVVTAYEPEWRAILPDLAGRADEVDGGVWFVRGSVAGAQVLLVESGVGPVNAALATQIAIDRFHAQRIVVAGIAGGVDPTLRIGDVAVPERWSEYLYSVFARPAGDGYRLPDFAPNKTRHYGMIFPQPVPVGSLPDVDSFAVDAHLLEVARDVAPGVVLERCRTSGPCLGDVPRVVVGGAGVSGPAFVDNADFRRFLEDGFRARAVDMESAAVAHVAAADKVPFIALRSLSDLAGGDADPNEMKASEAVAARNVATVFRAFIARLGEDDGRVRGAAVSPATVPQAPRR